MSDLGENLAQVLAHIDIHDDFEVKFKDNETKIRFIFEKGEGVKVVTLVGSSTAQTVGRTIAAHEVQSEICDGEIEIVIGDSAGLDAMLIRMADADLQYVTGIYVLED